MANSHFFEAPAADASHCIACEALLTDALDGTLGEIDQAWFDRHVGTCGECGSLFAEAQRGAAWLDLLKDAPPEPPANMVARILAVTTSSPTIERAPQLPAFPAGFFPPPTPTRRPAAAWARPLHVFFEPRLALTAAMALFSLALTMNLTGVRVGQLRPSNLRRSYYQSTAGVARYYDNLRVVHVLESRVDDLREENYDDQPSSMPTPRSVPARPQPSPRQEKSTPGNGVSRRQSPREAPPRILYAEFRAQTSRAGGLA